MEWYRDDLEKAKEEDPFLNLKNLLENNFDSSELSKIKKNN